MKEVTFWQRLKYAWWNFKYRLRVLHIYRQVPYDESTLYVYSFLGGMIQFREDHLCNCDSEFELILFWGLFTIYLGVDRIMSKEQQAEWQAYDPLDEDDDEDNGQLMLPLEGL